jgi:CheY-like chemotaxis protein
LQPGRRVARGVLGHVFLHAGKDRMIDQASVPSPVVHAAPTSSDIARILLVEDDDILRDLLTRALKRMGHDVTAATDGVDAVDRLIGTAATAAIPDLIISDVHMPRMDGLVLTDVLRRDARTREIPIILLSGDDELTFERAGIPRGAADHVSKPICVHELGDRIRVQLRRRRIVQAAAVA